MVLKARDAIRKGSEAKYAEADGRLGELSKLLPILQRRVESVDSIRAMKEFAALGGDSTWQELVAKTIPHEQGEVSRIELILGRLKRLVEEDASRALIAAKDFYREGGENALTHAAVAVSRLAPLVADLTGQLEALLIEIEGPLAVAQQSASEALAALNRTFALDKRDLQTAIEFEAEGSVEFMREAEGRGGELQAAVSGSIARLQDIDFERAQRYIDASKAEGLALADRIAEAKGKRDAAAEKRRIAESTLKDLNGRLSALQPLSGELRQRGRVPGGHPAAAQRDDLHGHRPQVRRHAHVAGLLRLLAGEQAADGEAGGLNVGPFMDNLGQYQVGHENGFLCRH